MSSLAGWIGPILFWLVAAAGGRGLSARLQGSRGWGTGFLAGFAAVLILAYLPALAGLPIGLPLFVAAGGIVGVGGILLGRSRAAVPELRDPWTPAERVLALGLAGYAFLAVVKAVFFPVTAVDAHSYAGRALFMLHDRTLDVGLYHWPEAPTADSNFSYPPLMSLAFAVTHAFGGWQPKIVNALLALAWPAVLFEALRERLPRFAALAWTLFLALTPEIFAHLSFDLLNFPAMALLTGEAIALAAFLETGDRRRLFPAGLFGAAAAGIRPDAVAIHGALWLAAGLRAAVGSRERMRLGNLPALLGAFLAPAITLGTWAFYLRHTIGLSPTGPLGGDHPIGLGPVLRAYGYFPFRTDTFGLVFPVFLAAVIFSGRPRRWIPAGLHVLAMTGTVAVAILLLYSRIDTGYGGGPGDVLPFSFKRALFYLVPLAGLAAALSPLGVRAAFAGRGWFHRDSRVRPAAKIPA